MKMKGMSLPINMIVVIAVAMLVLVAISAFFISGWGRGISTVELNEKWNMACQQWKLSNCAFGAPGEPTIILSSNVALSMRDGCKELFGIPKDDDARCRTQCCGTIYP